MCLIYAKNLGLSFHEDFRKFPILAKELACMLCPGVHFTFMILDGKWAYIGSVNLTGAGIGMKNDGKRNVKAGIFTDNLELVL